MITLIWSEQALFSLEEIVEFISRDSECYAKSFTAKIIEQVENLTAFPELGRKVPEFNDRKIRELIFHNYRIVYLVKEDSVNILYVGHSSKLIPELKIQ